MVTQPCSIFRVIPATFSSVRIFRIFKVFHFRTDEEALCVYPSRDVTRPSDTVYGEILGNEEPEDCAVSHIRHWKLQTLEKPAIERWLWKRDHKGTELKTYKTTSTHGICFHFSKNERAFLINLHVFILIFVPVSHNAFNNNYAPNFKEVGGAYCFRVLRLSVIPFVTLLMHAISCQPCMLGFWNFIYGFLMNKNSWPIFFFLSEFCPFLELCSLKQIRIKSCQQEISKTIWARGLKLGQLIGDGK